jgi:hypothetical protein
LVEKPEDLEKTTDLSQVTDKLDHIMGHNGHIRHQEEDKQKTNKHHNTEN